MAKKPIEVETLTHDATRKNIPTAEFESLIPAYSPNTRFQSARERVGDGFDLFCGFGTASRDGSGVIQAADG
jgi:adenine-specific DNA-methyltransferase